jgi:putative nucleotidyltransferase with HDIG domain
LDLPERAMSLYEQIGDELIAAAEPSWPRLVAEIPMLGLLDQTPQDPRHHFEGDVGVHTRLVLSELRSDPDWMALSLPARRRVAWGCLLHDIGKPKQTRTEDDGSITSRGHSGVGELMARRLMWDFEAPVADREAICRVAKWHQIPFFAGVKKDVFAIQKLSLSMDLSELALCARADARGRLTNPASEREKTLAAIDEFEIMARDLGVWEAPLACAGLSERGIWLSKNGENFDPAYPWPDPAPRALLVAACGLPGAGKSTLGKALGLPMVGLDWAREKLDAEHGDKVGQARSMALAELKKCLGRGSSVYFDATNLVADHRQRLAQIAADYQADCVFVHVEPPSPKEWLARNKGRGAKALPAKALSHLADRWGTPMGSEGAGQMYWSGSAPLPVWGTLGANEWASCAARAKASAQEPLGKPKQGRATM